MSYVWSTTWSVSVTSPLIPASALRASLRWASLRVLNSIIARKAIAGNSGVHCQTSGFSAVQVHYFSMLYTEKPLILVSIKFVTIWAILNKVPLLGIVPWMVTDVSIGKNVPKYRAIYTHWFLVCPGYHLLDIVYRGFCMASPGKGGGCSSLWKTSRTGAGHFKFCLSV